jgi:hypothetical protein
MSKIYEKLYEAAKLDSRSITVLQSNNLFAPAIYHCAQAVEKCSKSIHAYYKTKFQNRNEENIDRDLRGSYGHDLKQSTRGIIDSLMKLDIDYEIINNPKLKGKEKEAYESLGRAGEKVVQQILDMDEVVLGFNTLADKMYNLYSNFDTISQRYFNSNPTPEILRRALTDQDKRFYWYIFSAMLLASFLDRLELYSRYPMFELSNNNITILNSPQNKFAIIRIPEIINRMIELVPTVWKQIDLYKTTLS